MAEAGYYLLPVILALAALLGVTEGTAQWSRFLVEGLCLLLAMVQLQSLRRRRLSLHPVPGMLPLILLAGYLAVQLIPLPPGFLKLISPHTWDLYAGTVWLARPGAWMPLSIAPKLTLIYFFRLVSCIALYLLTVQLFAEKERLKRIIPALALFVGPLSIGLIILFLAPESRLWGILGKLPTTLKDHYAGLMAMVFPVLLAQYLASRPHFSYSSLREKAAKFLRHPGSYPHLLLGIAALLAAFAIIASLSMGGILSSLGGALLFLIFLLTRNRGRKKEVWGTAFLVGLLFTIGLAALGGNGGSEKSLQTRMYLTAEEKLAVWSHSQRIVEDFPLFGTGGGTFKDILPRYTPVSGKNVAPAHAYNDYLEFAVEGGAVGVLVGGWFLFAALRYSYPAWRQRHSRSPVYLYLGCLCGLTAILLQSCADFTLHVEAIFLYFFFLTGLAIASATTSSRPGGGGQGGRILPVVPRWPALLLGLLLFSDLVYNAGTLAARVRFAGIPELGRQQAPSWEDRQAMLRVARQASHLDPLNPRYRFAAADIALGLGEAAMAVNQLETTLRLAPLNAEYLQKLGLVFDNLGDGKKAEQLLQAGVDSDVADPEGHKMFAFWLLSKGEKEKALEQIRLAIQGEPEKTWDYLTLMKSQGLSDEAMRENLPAQSMAFLIYGDYLSGDNKKEAAEESYRTAVDLAAAESHPSPTVFQRVSEFFAGRDDYDNALRTIQSGITIFPNKAEFRFAAAGFYEKLGISYRAIEEYRTGLALDPKNAEARGKLKVLEDELQ